MVIIVNKLITFPSKIKGTVKISGSKNSSLAIIAASLVSGNLVSLDNVPNISDIKNFLEILNDIGVKTYFKNNKLKLKKNPFYTELLSSKIKEFRASYYLMSVFLILFKKVEILYPGGCSIGSRPIDFHLEGFKKAGCIVSAESSVIKIEVKELIPFVYELPKKSLGATVNLMILASKIEGMSIIKNASTEPEIDDLITFLNKGNVAVYRQKNDIVIKGQKQKVTKIKHKIIPDRIEAFTYIIIGLNSKKLIVKNIDTNHLKVPLYFIKKAGGIIRVKRNQITIKESIINKICVNSFDYPSLSTDQMPLLYPVITNVKGTSIFTEGIFDGRFKVCEELKKSGANIKVENNKVYIKGVNELHSADYFATDLRGAATLLIECILRPGSSLSNLHYLERGYDNIYNKLKKIGLNFKLE